MAMVAGSKRFEDVDIRCAGCGALLARRDGAALVVQRGGVEARFEGTFRAAFVCYRPECRRMTVLEVAADACSRAPAPA
jgi:hypothetical protein